MKKNHISLSSIKSNPNNPRFIKDEKFEKLVKSIKEFPKGMALRPIIVDSDGIVLGGNMRFKAINHLGYKEVPKEWVKYAEDLTEEEKKQFIIKDNVGYGEWDFDMLANEWDEEELEEWGMDLNFTEEEEKEAYTTNVESPVYEVKDEKPPISELTDTSKMNEFIAEIEKSSIPDKEKAFLIQAANRHCVFHYDRIADFYAHSSKDVQALMEKSALVIIDFNQAIENGYVKLTKGIQESYAIDFEDNEE